MRDITDFFHLLEEFASELSKNNVEIYNEDSVKHELAFFLRGKLDKKFKIQLERNIAYFGLNKNQFLKKEMDIVVYTPDQNEKHCIELKYPTKGQYPEQMFSSCKDVRFLEQLVDSGFNTSYFMMFADDSIFYMNKGDSGIYRMFRKEKIIRNTVRKPTGKKNQVFTFHGSYKIDWKDIKNKLKYFVIKVNNNARAH